MVVDKVEAHTNDTSLWMLVVVTVAVLTVNVRLVVATVSVVDESGMAKVEVLVTLIIAEMVVGMVNVIVVKPVSALDKVLVLVVLVLTVTVSI